MKNYSCLFCVFFEYTKNIRVFLRECMKEHEFLISCLSCLQTISLVKISYAYVLMLKMNYYNYNNNTICFVCIHNNCNTCLWFSKIASSYYYWLF
jgi:hypothetical protein